MLDSIISENPNPSSTTHASQPVTFASHDRIVDQESQETRPGDDMEEEIPTLNLYMTVGLLVVVTVVSCSSSSLRLQNLQPFRRPSLSPPNSLSRLSMD